jgi:hypothetical protein
MRKKTAGSELAQQYISLFLDLSSPLNLRCRNINSPSKIVGKKGIGNIEVIKRLTTNIEQRPGLHRVGDRVQPKT